MLEVSQLTKRFAQFTAIEDITFSIEAGEIFGFLGLNGAGKTTTIKSIAGLLKPSSGSVSIGGVDVHRDPVNAKRSLAYIPDSPFLYEKLTGREFLEFVGRVYQVSFSDIGKRVDELIALFGLEIYADQLAEGYSHGTRQKFVFASAFLHRPQLMLIDEPMVGLDPQNTHLVKAILRQVASEQKVAIMMSTHTLALAEEICDRIGIIHQGKLLACGTIDALKEKAHAQNKDLETLFLTMTGQYDEKRLDW